MTATWLEAAARRFEPVVRRWRTPGALARELNPKTVQTPALDLIDAELVRLLDTPDSRLIITMAPQEGKSVRVAGDLPVWALTQNPDMRIIAASYGQVLANRNGRSIRNRILANPDLGLRIAADNGAAGEWQIEGHEGGVYSVGIGAGVTGRACELLIVDDPIKSRAEADSKVYRDRVWDWWTDEAAARLAPGAPVVLILTRWHHDDLAGRLLAEEGSTWRVLNIPAECVDPDTDPLGRTESGEFMRSARGRTREQWEMRKKAAGSRTWASQYQGNPTPDTGNLFPVDGWSRYQVPLWVERNDGARVVLGAGDADAELVASWDLAFKGEDTSDFVVGQVWLRRGVHAYILDQVRGRWNFSETCAEIKNLAARWPQAIAKLVEDKANGPAVMNALRSQVAGLIPVEPEGSKYARAAAITPLVEAQNVHLPDPVAIDGTAWVTTLTEEARDFPQAKNDDTVDAMSQAVHRLLLVPILEGTVVDEDDLLGDEADLDWRVDAY